MCLLDLAEHVVGAPQPQPLLVAVGAVGGGQLGLGRRVILLLELEQGLEVAAELVLSARRAGRAHGCSGLSSRLPAPRTVLRCLVNTHCGKGSCLGGDTSTYLLPCTLTLSTHNLLSVGGRRMDKTYIQEKEINNNFSLEKDI